MLATALALDSLGNPMRRKIFERLRSGPLPVSAIAHGLPVSRPAVSQHLSRLRQAGLVNHRPNGTQRLYFIDPAGLGALRAWLDQFWDEALTSFHDDVERSVRSAKAEQK